jgi:hypothetical protein
MTKRIPATACFSTYILPALVLQVRLGLVTSTGETYRPSAATPFLGLNIGISGTSEDPMDERVDVRTLELL